MALSPDEHQNLIDRLLELFQSNEAAIDYGENPSEWVDEHLPEGTEPADVARCMPEVGERLGGPYQQNLAHYTSHAAPVTTSVINEISYTYNTIYQQNAFIYAEEGAQVTNIQGDGNTVTQVQIDDSFDVDLPYEDGEPEPEEPTEEPTEDPGEDTDGDEPWEDHDDDGYDDGGEPEGEPEDEPWEDPAGDEGYDDGGEPEGGEEPPAEDTGDTGDGGDGGDDGGDVPEL